MDLEEHAILVNKDCLLFLNLLSIILLLFCFVLWIMFSASGQIRIADHAAQCQNPLQLRQPAKRSGRLGPSRLPLPSSHRVTTELLLAFLCLDSHWLSFTKEFFNGLDQWETDVGRDEMRTEWSRHVFLWLWNRLWPNYSSAHNNLGTILLGRSAGPATDIERHRLVDEAERHFRQALNVHQTHVHARYNLAIISMWDDSCLT